MAAMTTVPSYTPSLWVRLCHALPRLDLTMQMKDNIFVPDSWEYQQTLLVLSSLSAIALVISLLVVLSFLIHYCCCHRGDRSEGSEEEEEDEDASTGHGYSGKKGRGICCVTWVAISDTIAGLQLSISGPLASMEELFTGSKPFLVSTRNCRRLSENVVNLLSSISLARASVDAGLGNDSGISGASIIPLTPVPPSVAPTVVPTGGIMPNPFSPGWAANTLMVNEDYRWLSYVLLLLLDLIVCLFILLGLAKQARWLLILMTVLAWLALFLSWGSLGLETATVVALSDFCSDPNTFVLNSTNFNTGTGTDVLDYYLTCSRRMNSPFQQLLTQSQRALSNIHTHLSNLDRNALTQFPKAEKSLREVQQILNSTEGNFHQLVALLNCRGLNKDYIDSLKGLCYDGMEGLLYLSLYSFLSALAFTAILCSLPGAWRSFPRTPNVSSNGNPGYESLPLTDRQSPPPSVSSSVFVTPSQSVPFYQCC
ncbi:Protein tweety -like protein 1 [Collichthys lucidus]|uniref:Protein tweety homolog n=1 Tax=Collichthys lucidus TaxID=240159 RepID=A0A4V6AQW6_COLLU|nr:Protein tweety -like protein 1 [Collichthys lucidus]